MSLLTLPEEVVQILFSFLPSKDLGSIMLTCHRFSYIGGHPSLWKNFKIDLPSDVPIALRMLQCTRLRDIKQVRLPNYKDDLSKVADCLLKTTKVETIVVDCAKISEIQVKILILKFNNSSVKSIIFEHKYCKGSIHNESLITVTNDLCSIATWLRKIIRMGPTPSPKMLHSVMVTVNQDTKQAYLEETSLVASFMKVYNSLYDTNQDLLSKNISSTPHGKILYCLIRNIAQIGQDQVRSQNNFP